MFKNIFLAFFLFISFNVFAQSYGLEFFGHEVNPDKRTSLVIGSRNSLCIHNGFEFSFDLKLKSNVTAYYGYIFRMVNSEGENLDLLYKSDYFKLVTKDLNLTNSFGLDSIKLYNSWSRFRLVFDPNNKNLSLFLGNKLVEKKTINFNSNSCFKLYFGECSDSKYATRDVLPMYLRDIQIKVGDELKYSWKLNQAYGEEAYESQNQNLGLITNGFWLLKGHYEWKQLANQTIKGYTTFYFDDSQNDFLIHSDSGVYTSDDKNLDSKFKKFQNSYQKFTFGDQALLLNTSKNAVNVRLSEKEIYVYDKKQNNWNIPSNLHPELTEYWHHNSILFPEDSAIALIGGYGQFTYKNKIQKYSFVNKVWSDLKLIGDVIEPRYLFGIGNTKNFGKSYLFGGYGSKTGNQELNPENYYDLFEIDWKKNTVKKLYQLEVPKSPFVVVKSMVVDEKNQVFYALIYNQLNFKSQLQLIKGSLVNPEYELVGKPIPYDFQDVSSFADLAFDKKNERLLCITSFYDRLKNISIIKTYSLDFPPTNIIDKNATSSILGNKLLLTVIIVFVTLILVALIIHYFFFPYQTLLNKLKKPETVQSDSLDAHEPQQLVGSIDSKSEIVKSKVILFGGFQFVSSKGEDLTIHFSPLLKELFLYLLLNSIKWKKSVNSQQLNEMFWFDKSESSARNNRSVNLTKLKVLFEQVGHIQISKESGDWQIIYDNKYVCVDYADFLQITGDKKNLSKEEINQLTKIVSRGNFLSNLEFEWLESFKSEISNRVIDTYLAYSKSLNFETDAQEIIEIADKIFVFDAIDETAMEMKCKALVKLGKHSLAQKCYEHFNKEYVMLYGEKFSKSFKDII